MENSTIILKNHRKRLMSKNKQKKQASNSFDKTPEKFIFIRIKKYLPSSISCITANLCSRYTIKSSKTLRQGSKKFSILSLISAT